MDNFQKYISALREASVVFAPNDERPTWVITAEPDVISDMGLVISLCDRIAKGDGTPPFSIREEGRGAFRRRQLHKNPLGDMFAQVLRADFSRFSLYYPYHTLHPAIGVVQSAIEDRCLAGFDLRSELPFVTNLTALVGLVDRLNGCFADTRKRLVASTTRRKTDDFTRNARKNCLSLTKYFNATLEVFGSALVQRAELFFRKGRLWPNSTDQVGVDYKAVRGYIAKLRDILSELPEGYLLGHVLRLDHSLERGYVVHVVLFANPVVRSETPEGIIGSMGRKWSEITAGKGAYYEYGGDIPFPQASYKRCGTGLCYANDPIQKQQLRDAALYLSMLDCFVRLNTPGRDRTLWRGLTPKASKQNLRCHAAPWDMAPTPWTSSNHSTLMHSSI